LNLVTQQNQPWVSIFEFIMQYFNCADFLLTNMYPVKCLNTCIISSTYRNSGCRKVWNLLCGLRFGRYTICSASQSVSDCKLLSCPGRRVHTPAYLGHWDLECQELTSLEGGWGTTIFLAPPYHTLKFLFGNTRKFKLKFQSPVQAVWQILKEKVQAQHQFIQFLFSEHSNVLNLPFFHQIITMAVLIYLKLYEFLYVEL
jgi:hypothetical protein